MEKKRADHLLVEQGLAESREKAQALILAGQVSTPDRPVRKAGEKLPADTPLHVKGSPSPYASRGGLKLEHALSHFSQGPVREPPTEPGDVDLDQSARRDDEAYPGVRRGEATPRMAQRRPLRRPSGVLEQALNPTGKVALDVGASTGGFTSCLLLRGAKKVYALDVGHNQLAWKLRQDPRVVVMEGQNARYLTPDLFPDPIELVTCDVSFISLRLILPAIVRVAAPSAPLVLLIKPQFEVGPKEVGKGGVVRDPALHERVCEEISQVARELGCTILGITPSPITGPAGNREFLLGAIAPGMGYGV